MSPGFHSLPFSLFSAVQAAEEAGVPAMLDADDMVVMARPDPQSVMTYLAAMFRLLK